MIVHPVWHGRKHVSGIHDQVANLKYPRIRRSLAHTVAFQALYGYPMLAFVALHLAYFPSKEI
jgi:hypothetical protein